MNIKGYGYDDRYTYDDSDVLKNKFDIRDAAELEAVERRFFAERASTLTEPVVLTPEAFSAVHKHLFQDVYDWAGEYRDVDIAKGQTRFCVARFIDQELRKRFEAFAADGRLDTQKVEDFADALAEHVIELNMIHPFREGIGRMLRVFLLNYAAQRGHRLDLTKVRPKDWMGACIEGVSGETKAMSRVLRRALIRQGQVPAEDCSSQQNRRRQRPKQR